MKNILISSVFLLALTSCGAEQQAKELLDSARKDSAAKAVRKADSAHDADSLKNAANSLLKKDSASGDSAK